MEYQLIVCTIPPTANLDRETTLRNGQNTNAQEYNPPNFNAQNDDRDNNRRADVRLDRGLHESFDWYDACYARERNQGQD